MNIKSFKEIKKVYMIGIAGVGMTGLAQVLAARGIEVAGSDINEEFITNPILEKLGIKVHAGFKAEHIPEDADLIISSSAYLRDESFNPKEKTYNPEVVRAKKLDKLISYPEALGMLVGDYETIAVSGCHGKTTTTSLLGFVLSELGFNPTVIVGGEVLNWGANALVGKPGGLLIIEADEYKDAFKNYKNLLGAIITSISYDHPDYFAGLDAYKKSFLEFTKNIRPGGFLVNCSDDQDVSDVVNSASSQIEKIRYGFNGNYENGIDSHVIGDYKANRGFPLGSQFRIGNIEFSLRLAGVHNALNSAAVLASVNAYLVRLGKDTSHYKEKIKNAFSKFQGTRRRFEVLLEKPVTIIDDYAHHPDAVKACIRSTREIWPDKRLVAAFQPHTFSRTAALCREFAKALSLTDKAVIIDIYASAREKRGNIHSSDLVNEVNKIRNVAAYVSRERLVEYMRDNILKEEDILLIMGAGDIWKLANEITKSV